MGRLLYYALILFILEAWFYWIKLVAAYQESSTLWVLFWTYSFLFSFVHIFLVLADGWSRFQNYKRAKDQFFIHGFHKKIAHTYIGSKCQRMAAEVAAEELGLQNQIKKYYAEMGVKWYHYVPYFMIREPLFLFNKKFWSRTFLEKNYTPKFDYNNLQPLFQA
ncbi:MAG TPA: hypothetical protein VJ552_02185 [Sediminibacterium sp.]|nr:hypothetical protein [Sediminibacterium sp.]